MKWGNCLQSIINVEQYLRQLTIYCIIYIPLYILLYTYFMLLIFYNICSIVYILLYIFYDIYSCSKLNRTSLFASWCRTIVRKYFKNIIDHEEFRLRCWAVWRNISYIFLINIDISSKLKILWLYLIYFNDQKSIWACTDHFYIYILYLFFDTSATQSNWNFNS